MSLQSAVSALWDAWQRRECKMQPRLTESQKAILERIVEKWQHGDMKVEADKFSTALVSSVIGAMMHTFIDYEMSPPMLLDAVMHACADHVAGLLVTLINSDIITEGEAIELLQGSGDALERNAAQRIGELLARLRPTAGMFE